MSTDRVSVAVVTWNSIRDIGDCLKSLLAQTHKLTRIVVVDNASTDGTPDYVKASFPGVELIPLDYNAGFAKGNNIGIETAQECDWILLLNPDAQLETNWVERLLEFARNQVMVGALGGVLWRSGGDLPEKAVVDSLGIEIYKSRRVRDFGSGEGRDILPKNPIAIFGICAAAVLYNRRMLDDIAIDGEIFPERFFCYYEDADLAWRSWRRGWHAWTVPSAEGFHRRGGSPIGSRFSRFYTHRNRLWMILRNDSPGNFLRAIPELFLHELYMLARVIRYPYLLKAVCQSILGIGKSLAERRKFKERACSAIPFKSGIGFSRKEKLAAIKPIEKNFH